MDHRSLPDDARPSEPTPDGQPSQPPTQTAGPSSEFDPFPFGAPAPGSPVAAAFPELYPEPAPVDNPYAPPAAAPYAPPAQSTYDQPGASPWSPAGQPAYGQGDHPIDPSRPAYGFPPPYRPGAGQPSGYPYGSAKPGSNGKAVAGMVLGILALGFFFFTVLDIPLIVLGIVFSLLGLRGARRGEGRRGMALAGLICSILAAVVVTVALTYVVSRGHTCDDRYDRGTSEFNNCLLHLN